MPSDAKELAALLRGMESGQVKLMEVCGTHTMAIAKAGIRSLLPEGTELLSGPGCPVCVTSAGTIDAALELAAEPGVRITTYGDMLRVPGSRPGDSLLTRRARGAKVDVVYSPMDAIDLAEAHPDEEIVFLGVGFETTAPGTAAAVLSARERGVKNFSVFSMLKRVEPALRALLAEKDFAVNGFLCPGHVATVLGAEGFAFLPEEYRMPAVVGGFEPEEILLALCLLLRQIGEGRPRLENAYPRAVKAEGNRLAQRMIARCLEPRSDTWRGLGEIAESGLGLREDFAAFDAEKKFAIAAHPDRELPGCRCGEVICGRCRPSDCPFFGRRCVPEDPVGPCMVSSEGACAAAYKYQTV